MEAYNFDQRHQETQSHQRERNGLYIIFIGSIFVLLSHAVSIAVTLFILDTWARRREVRQFQEQLIRNAGSASNEIAKDAINQLRRLGWLEGGNGLLQGQNLQGADLSNLPLWNANLKGVNLRYANLNGAGLRSAYLGGADLQAANLNGAELESAHLNNAKFPSANLSGADLSRANLSGSTLTTANLSKARLTSAYLGGADLRAANLSSANLWAANLNGACLSAAELNMANLQGAIFDLKTTLPDGSKWTPESDLKRFTDPEHPDFWRPQQYGTMWQLPPLDS